MSHARPVFLFTDFGYAGPYVGQMSGAILSHAPGSPVISLMHDAPAMRPELAAYLLSACCRSLPVGSVVVGVVDPGVGGERAALMVETKDLMLIGPDNGLLSRVQGITRVQRIDWRPESLSVSFHGRDLFAPAAAMLSVGESLARTAIAYEQMVGSDWPDDLSHIVYIDAFGNMMTGVSAENCNDNNQIDISGHRVEYAETFCKVPPGRLFWYRNSLGLVEISANRSSAASMLSLALGDKILLD